MIKLDWTLFLQFANFMVLMAVLNTLLFRPLRNVLSERRTALDGSRARIADLEEQARVQQARYEEQLQAARLQAGQQRAELRRTAQQEEASILGEANRQAGERLNTLKAQVATDATTARQALRTETESLAREIAGKVLGRGV